MQSFIYPHWNAPVSVHAVTTTRNGGVSQQPYSSLNLGTDVGDYSDRVIRNQQYLKQQLSLQSDPLWLKQAHGNKIIAAQEHVANIEADGCYTTQPRQVCAITTADCLPILMTNQSGNFIMALHAGWRSLAKGIIERGLSIANHDPNHLIVWLGPAIHQPFFEVGEEVKEQFTCQNSQHQSAFVPSRQGRWLMDIYKVARQKLQAHQVFRIYQTNWCSYYHQDFFYSYRRDQQTGRMATLIWIV